MKFKKDKIIFEPGDMEQIEQYLAEMEKVAKGWVSTKKSTPLTRLFNKKHRKALQNQAPLDEMDFLKEEARLLDIAEEYEQELHQATRAFSRAAYKLNLINAQLNRDPVNLEDELLHHGIAQETLNKNYIAENVRYYKHFYDDLEQRLAPPAEEDRQK